MNTPLLHQHFSRLRETLPHIGLSSGPTPVRPLDALPTGHAPVWLKDDSAFGDGGWGGNKVRKLEWILPEAHRRGSRTILTVGGLGTNWGLAVALYARDHGLGTALALVDQPVDEHVRAQLSRLENSGAALHFTHSKTRTILTAPILFAQHTSGGHLPYYLPPGGSAPIGVLGYVEAALELAGQVHRGELPEPTHLVTAVGSGGTIAGLQLGLRMAGLTTRAVGIVVNDTLRLDPVTITRLAHRTARLLRQRGADLSDLEPRREDIDIITDWLGSGYGHPTPEGERAQTLSVDREHLHLEPVYTAKAMAALLAMNEQGVFGNGPVLYLNTNGPR